MEKIQEYHMTKETAEDIRAFSELAEEILCGGAYRVTKYLSEKRTIKATRKLYKGGWKRREAVDIVFTLGKPNYEEREAIKREKKAGRGTIEMTIKMPPKVKK